MGKPKISVVLTTYNRSLKLKRAIESVLKQTFKDWELIIVDDCSKDDTQEVIKSFKDERIRCIKRSRNYGQHTRPKNEGTKAAKSDLIAYLDDDNEYMPDHLQVLWKALERNSGLAGVYGDRILIDEEGDNPDAPGIRSDWTMGRLLVQNYIDTGDVLIKKEVIEEIGGWDETLPKFADWNLFVRIGKAGYKMQRVAIPISKYYMHKGMNQLKTDTGRDEKTGFVKPTFDPIDCPIWPKKTIYGKAKKLKVAIFSLVMNRLEYTEETFDTMKENAGYKYDHFVVDNNSNSVVRDWLKVRESSGAIKKLITNDKNVGISKGSNQALEEILKGKYDIIIKVDNDCRFITEDWLKTIVKIYGSVRGYILSPYVEGLIDHPGGVPRRRPDNPSLSPYGYLSGELIGFAPHLGGICCAAPRSVYEKFKWKEEDFLHGIQDFEFSQWCLKNGYVLAYVENLKVEHIDTTLGQDEKYPDYAEEKKGLKTRKYEKS